uniref:Uncharacterized protein n=1 Tax=Palpitomonas bilix TaxID=652834 RepID=A0A7S3LWY5_9EUKA|mmetsp:Transcript_7206/g.18702  ORF Transcript_7206/g.18702 Transcript_7206/m.18702 type:complete len:310 (+) Transcript_7206:80-1009(+)
MSNSDSTGVTVAEKAQDEAVDALKDLFAGTVAGIVSKVIEFPLDTIKVRLQYGGSGGQSFKGPIDAFRKTIAEEGALGLYRGLPSPMMGAMMENATLFATYGRFKSMLTAGENRPLTIKETFVAGCGAGFCAAFILTPVELVKCRMQVQELEMKAGRVLEVNYKNTFDCFKRTLFNEGLSGLYRGHIATLLREIPGNGAWFATYEIACNAIAAQAGCERYELGPLSLIAAGGLGGMAYWSAFYPADTVKSKMQTASVHEKQTFLSVMRKTFANEGVSGLYRGFGLTLVRAVPANAAIFAVYEMVSRAIA